MITLPEYYKLVKTGNDDIGQWVAVAPEDVPAETGLHKVDFSNPEKRTPIAYVTPEEKESCWKTPGLWPAFQVKTGRWQHGDLLLVSVRRPACLAQCRFDQGGTRRNATKGRTASPELDKGSGIPSSTFYRETGGN